MNRRDFQRLADMRLKEEQLLFDNAQYSGAYYLAGYAIECALKACICRKTQAEDFPLDRRALENVYTHDLEKLLKRADLTGVHQQQVSTDPTQDPLVTAIRVVNPTGPTDITGIRFTSNSINHVFIEDAYIYRVA